MVLPEIVLPGMSSDDGVIRCRQCPERSVRLDENKSAARASGTFGGTRCGSETGTSPLQVNLRPLVLEFLRHLCQARLQRRRLVDPLLRRVFAYVLGDFHR